MNKLVILLGLTLLPSAPAGAAPGYVLQSTFSLPPSSIAGMDTDALGNLYVLGNNGSGTHYVRSYATPQMAGLFSFDTGISSPAAFAVEGSGAVDILDASGGIGALALTRFQNNGTVLGKTTFSAGNPYYDIQLLSAAIDKRNKRILIGEQHWYSIYCVMIYPYTCAPSGYRGFIHQYDFQGTLLKTIVLPGVSATAGTCYTPSRLAVDPQGNIYVADHSCQHLFKYGANGTLLSDRAASSWGAGQFFAKGMWTDADSNLYISQSICGPSGCPPGIVMLSPAVSLQTSFVTDSAIGCAWDPRIQYLATASGEPVKRFVYDSPPSIASGISPLNTIYQHTNSVTLNWQASSDPEGDGIAYNVFVGPSANQLVYAGSTTQTSLFISGINFGQPYYWQIVAQDIYSGIPVLQQPTPVVSFTLAFSNNPPETFAAAAGIGNAVTRSTSVTLGWKPSIDPDGDPVAYDVYWRRQGQSSATLLGSTAGTSWPVSGLSYSTTYYWSIVANDPYGAATTIAPVEASYSITFKNSPPTIPANQSSVGTVLYHGLNPGQSFFWQSATDPDGDLVSYTVFAGTDPANLSAMPNAPLGFSLTNLAINTAYYYKIVATDIFGAAQDTPLNWVYYQFSNTAPRAFDVVSGTGTVLTRNMSGALSWKPAVDPEGDAIAYRVYTGTASNALSLAADQSGTNFTIAPLAFGATYYWRVEAYDSFGATTSINGGLQALTYNFQNAPPSTPAYLTTAQAYAVHNASAVVALAWAPAVDSDGDPISYGLDLTTVSPASIAFSSFSSASVSGALRYSLNASLGTTYYWRISAIDPYGGASTGPWQSVYAYFLNRPPIVLDASLASMPSGAVRTSVNSLRMTWPVYASPDDNIITYFLYLTNGGETLVYSGSSNSYTLGGLSYSVPYAYRVEVRDNYGGVTAGPSGAFTLASDSAQPEPYNYPNPFRIGGGTRLVFTAPGGVDHLRISVYSAFQDLIWRKDIGPLTPGVHEISWDGNDLSGHKVFSGLYVAVFDSPLGRQTMKLVGVR